jgi:hypothetical protein
MSQAEVEPNGELVAGGGELRERLLDVRSLEPHQPHLYAVMFGPGLAAFRLGDPADLEAARSTFVSLLRRIHACINAGRFEIDDVTTAGEAVWSVCTATPRSSTPGSSVRSAATRCACIARSSPACRSASAMTPSPPLARCRRPDGGPSAPTELRPAPAR